MHFRAAAAIAVAVAWTAGSDTCRGEPPPAANYMIHCMGCHLADGSGSPPEVPDVRGEMGRMLAVAGGREYLVQVPGAAQAPISDAALAGVVNYMLETFSAGTLPENYRPLTGDEVAEWRQRWMPDVASVRREILAALDGDTSSGSVATPRRRQK